MGVQMLNGRLASHRERCEEQDDEHGDLDSVHDSYRHSPQ